MAPGAYIYYYYRLVGEFLFSSSYFLCFVWCRVCLTACACAFVYLYICIELKVMQRRNFLPFICLNCGYKLYNIFAISAFPFVYLTCIRKYCSLYAIHNKIWRETIYKLDGIECNDWFSKLTYYLSVCVLFKNVFIFAL